VVVKLTCKIASREALSFIFYNSAKMNLGEMMSVNTVKYQNLILFLCQCLGNTIHGKKKLAKLLYYCDFDRYEYKESMRSITGDTYQAYKMGPVPRQYMKIVEILVSSKKLVNSFEEFSGSYRPVESFTALQPADLSVFDADDLAIINRVVVKYGHLNGKELETLTHAEAPYVAAEPMEDIIYDMTYYRGTDFSDAMAVA
jgi:uncharacterized phage-associated protein